MVRVGVYAKLVETDTRCLRFLPSLSARRQLPLRQSFSVEALHNDGNLSSDENLQSLCCNRNARVFCSNGKLDTPPTSDEKLETHGIDGNHHALLSNGELETICDHGRHESLRRNGEHEILRDLEALYSRKKLANLYSSSKIPSDEDIQALCRDGALEMALRRLSHMQTIPSLNTYLSLLQACTKQKSLAQVKRVHADLADHHLHVTTFLGGYVVNALAKCGGLVEALHLFCTLPQRTVHSYSCLISALADRCLGREALQMWVVMQKEGIEPNEYTYVGLLKACGTIPDLKEGKMLHGEVRLKGLGGNVFVASTLVSMYSRCGSLDDAENVFCELTEHNVIVWNSMLTAYVEHKEGGKALLVYRQMLEQGPDRDQGTFVLALQACSILAEKMEGFARDAKPIKTGILSIGRALHADARRNGFAFDVVIGSALVTMYGKCGTFSDAEYVFFGLPQQDTALWNAMLLAYVDAGEGRKSLRFYLHMQEEGIIPDEQTITIALCACGAIAEKEETIVVKQQDTRLLPAFIISALEMDVKRNNIVVDDVFCNTLIFVYGKCGAVAKAEEVFSRLPDHSTVSWNAMLSVYIENHNVDKALQVHKRLQEELVPLDGVTLTYVLQACNELGCAETCKKIHFALTSADRELDTLLATILLRTYGGCASMENAESVFNELLEPDMLSWDACMAGYAQGENCMNLLEMLDKMQMEHVNPDGVTFIHVVSACNHAGLVEEGTNYFNFMTSGYGLSPERRHYAALIDLFGRAGNLARAKAIIGKMPMQLDLAVWSSLLNASWIHGNAELESWASGQQEFAKDAISSSNAGPKTFSK